MLIKGMKNTYLLIVTNMYGKNVGIIPQESLSSVKRGIKSVSEITFSVDKFYGADNKLNLLYEEIKNERYIKLDNDETYVIKSVTEINEKVKDVTAYAKEKKLFKNTIELEDVSITLKTPYADIKDCYSLGDILYKQTGWKLGYISPEVLYNSTKTSEDILFDNENFELTTEEKLRYQESISTNWYDYINNDISEQFECYPIFDSYNKIINLYSDKELGGKLGLILTYDNFLKNKEKVSDTEEIITMLTLEGNNGLTIEEYNPSGLKYLEDYSYFIENQEMSEELILALNKYEEMNKIRIKEWDKLRKEKQEKLNILTTKQNEILVIYSKIESLKIEISLLKDEAQKAKKQEELVKKIDEKVLMEAEISGLNESIKLLTDSIERLNKLCKKEYATDNDGHLIFNEKLLADLTDYIYQDVYSNDCITDKLSLMSIGKRRLKQLCKSTKTWSVDSKDFVEKLIDNDFRKHWNGELGLGDMILLKDGDSFIPIYLVGYTQDLKQHTIQLELSNKKEDNSFSLSIGERLTQAKEAYEKVKKQQSIVNSVKRNTWGLNYDKINKEIL